MTEKQVSELLLTIDNLASANEEYAKTHPDTEAGKIRFIRGIVYREVADMIMFMANKNQ